MNQKDIPVDDGVYVNVSIRLPKDFCQRVDDIAKKTERSRAYLIRSALKEWLFREEEKEKGLF